ncbi:MAG: hypothetical protein AAF493_08055 [Pseudomonadota bacterium]
MSNPIKRSNRDMNSATDMTPSWIKQFAKAVLSVGASALILFGSSTLNASADTRTVAQERYSDSREVPAEVIIDVADELYYLDELDQDEQRAVARTTDALDGATRDCALTPFKAGQIAECWGLNGEKVSSFSIEVEQEREGGGWIGCIFTQHHMDCSLGDRAAVCLDKTFDGGKWCAHSCPCNSDD